LKLFSRNKKREYLIRHEVDGTAFYVYQSALALPYKRQLFFQSALKEAELGITTKDIRAIINLMHDALNNNDIVQASSYLSALRMYMDLYASNEIVFKIGDSVILLEDEPEEDMSEVITEKKKKLFQNDKVKGFFLSTLQTILLDLGKLSNDFSLEDYLRNQQVLLTEMHLRRLIEGNT
jgi:hypothetical protein